MSESAEGLRRKIGSAAKLQGVVRTMKALAAASIGQYEQSVRALADYHRTVELGLGVCLRATAPTSASAARASAGAHGLRGAVVFGSDQGLVGPFNDRITEYAIGALKAQPGKVRIWAVGERVESLLRDAGLSPAGLLPVPTSVQAIAQLVGQILVDTEAHRGDVALAELQLFHNRPASGAVYEPAGQRLLPLDEAWRRRHAGMSWPTAAPPEALGGVAATLPALIREYLFVSLYRACAESLASENASRLAAMQRAERNIDELLEQLWGNYHRLRQGGIDAELFDLTSGFAALAGSE